MSNLNGTGRARTAIFNVAGEADPDACIDVTLDSADANIVDVTIDETRLHIEVQHLDHGLDQHSVPRHLYCTVNGIAREFSICRAADGHTHVLADGYAARLEVRAGPKRTSASPEERETIGKSPLIVAPMPATVLEILVDASCHVRVDDPVIRVEAMKMITTLNATVTGVVREIAVTEGQTVGVGQMLVRIEPLSDAAAGAALKIT